MLSLLSCNAIKEGYINVHLVPHTHDDVGWLKTVDEYFYGLNMYTQAAGVQYILDSVVDSLQKDPSRRFIYVETAFFWKWWTEQTEDMKSTVRRLVENGQLEFISGGWSMNDEAVTNYQSIIDQMTWGLRRLNDTFGICGIPKVAWQIDPFGHSREMANIFKQLGFDAFILNRIDYQDKSQRAVEKQLEFMWKASDFLADSNIFTSILLKHYNSPVGLCFDVSCFDDAIVDDTESPVYNADIMLDYFYMHVVELVGSYRTQNILVTMGDDFSYQDAAKWYTNLDKLISLVNAEQTTGSLFNALYSTPSCYIKAVYDETGGKFNTDLKTDDFFPYASEKHSYWTGFYSSRPALKRFERIGNNFLQICKQLTSLTGLGIGNEDKLTLLREAMGVMQHHDAITGTEKLVVSMDYARMLQMGIDSCEDLTFSVLNKLLVNVSSQSTREAYKDIPNLQLTTCLLTNISQCAVSEDSESFVVTLYNPLGKPVNKFVRLPVKGTAYVVTDSQGNNLTTDLIPIPKSVQILPGRNTTATVDLTFLATELPPLGFKSYFVQKISGNNIVVQNNSTSEANSTFVGVVLDQNTGFLSNIQVNGTYYEVNQSLWYYVGNLAGLEDGSASGAYVFQPTPNETLKFRNVTDKADFYEIYRGQLVTEIHQRFSNWTSQIIRLYKDENFVEFDWLIGYPDYTNGLPEVSGKEYVTKFKTKLNSSKSFYTDSNGRHVLERVRNYRPTWNATIAEPESGNYYPVVSKILLKDEETNLEFAVLTDRAQGGSSLKDGEVELMVSSENGSNKLSQYIHGSVCKVLHGMSTEPNLEGYLCSADFFLIYRNCLTDDGFGVGEALVELQYGTDIAVRGSHYVFIGLADLPLKQMERDVELRKLFDSWVYLAPANGYTYESYKASHRMEFSGLQRSLPSSVHLLTLEPWKNDSTLLLRLEHLSERTTPVWVDIQDLFSTFKLKSIKETTLGANQWLEDSQRLDFTQSETEETSILEDNLIFTEVRDDYNNAYNITLVNSQIRTFVVEIEY